MTTPYDPAGQQPSWSSPPVTARDDAGLQAALAAIPCTCGGEDPAKGRTGHHAWCNRNAVDIGTVAAVLTAARPYLAAEAQREMGEHIQGIIRGAQQDPHANPWETLAHIDVGVISHVLEPEPAATQGDTQP